MSPPISLPDVARELSEHKKSTEDSFDGMKKAFDVATKQYEELNQKQDAQIQTLNQQNQALELLLKSATESALERGRRVEREKQDRERKAKAEKRERQIKWVLRFLVVPLLIAATHLLTKANEQRKQSAEPAPQHISASPSHD